MAQTITRFNVENLRELRLEIEGALGEIAKRRGIKLELGSIGYDREGGSFASRLKGQCRANVDAEAKRFDEIARLRGLDVSKRGPKGERLVGYNRRARSKPWIVEGAAGEKLKCDDRSARFFFGADDDKAVAS